MSNTDRLLSGELDHVFKTIGVSDINSKYESINPNSISYSEMRGIIQSNSELMHLKDLWFANVGRNGMTANVEKDIEQTSKERLQKQLYAFTFGELEWPRLARKILSFIFEEGNCIVRFVKVKDGKIRVIVESLEFWDVKHDRHTDTTSYRKMLNGAIQDTVFTHGVEIYHFKDPKFENWVVAPARLNLAYAYLLMELAGVKSNVNLFQKGGIGVILLSLNEAAAKFLNADNTEGRPNEQGKSKMQLWLDDLYSKISGVKNSNSIRSLPGLDKVFELGKDNKQMQFVDLIGTIAPERIAWAWGITLADLGAGDNTTYNNTQTFSYVLYEKEGRHLEDAINEILNNWLLNQFNFPTSIYGDISITYDRPSNPDRIAYQEQARKDWLSNAITLNEYRNSQDLPPINNGDVYLKDWTAVPETEETGKEASLNALDYKETGKKKAFLNKWKKAIGKQLKDFLTQMKEDNPKDVSKYEVKIKPIETYYSFPNLKQDLGKFAEKTINEFKNDKRVKNKNIQFGFDDYPELVKLALEFRTLVLLKGMEVAIAEIDNPLIAKWMGILDFEGVDTETSKEIRNFLADYPQKTLTEMITDLTDRFDEMTEFRADRIARTEISNAVEGTRYIMYQEEFGLNATSTWDTAGDERVGDDHAQNDGEVRKLGAEFTSGETRPGQRPNCRCTSSVTPPDDY